MDKVTIGMFTSLGLIVLNCKIMDMDNIFPVLPLAPNSTFMWIMTEC